MGKSERHRVWPMSVVMVLHLWTVLCRVEGTEPLSAHCQYRAGGQRSVLVVTLHDPLPAAWEYYILVERLDDPNVFFEESRLVQITEEAMVYEVYNIPSDETRTYEVRVRPRGKNSGYWIRGYQYACKITIPPPPSPPSSPPPPSPPPPSPPPPSPSSPPPLLPSTQAVVSPTPTVLLAGVIPELRTSSSESGESADTGMPADEDSRWFYQTSKQAKDERTAEEEEEDLPVMTIAVMSGVVAFCLFVCLSVTVAVWVHRKRWTQTKQNTKSPTNIPTSQPEVPDGHTPKTTFDDTDARPEDIIPCPKCALMMPSAAAADADDDDNFIPWVHSPHHHHHCNSIISITTVSDISHSDCDFV